LTPESGRVSPVSTEVPNISPSNTRITSPESWPNPVAPCCANRIQRAIAAFAGVKIGPSYRVIHAEQLISDSFFAKEAGRHRQLSAAGPESDRTATGNEHRTPRAREKWR
jgi:hypothetical protein